MTIFHCRVNFQSKFHSGNSSGTYFGNLRFLKYVPDNFLSTEQIEAKHEAQKSDYKNYNRYVAVFENDKDGGDNKFSLLDVLGVKEALARRALRWNRIS